MFRKRTLWFILAPLALIAAVLLWAILTYPSAYVWRPLLWGNSDVSDYRKFPARPLQPAAVPFHFKPGADESRVRTLFAANPRVGDLDSFLTRTGTQAFIVIQDDRILYEKYFNGYQRDSIVTSFSAAKSFDSALIGFAIAEGRIGSVDDPITQYLPELSKRDPAFSHITIRDLLTMSSGIKYVEFPFFTGDDTKTYYYSDLRRLALDGTEVAGEPGIQFLYNNYNPLLLGLIIERATGKSVTQYLQEKIWTPLGMEFPGSWSLDSAASGFEKMESGINGRAIDFAKLGRLYLHEGDWDGTRLLPAQWVAGSTRENPAVNRAAFYPKTQYFGAMKGYYGYMWWGIHRDGDGHDFSAIGKYGQYIYVSPAKNLIIVRFGERYGVEFDEWMQILSRFAGDIAS